jgi:hypothetical protein
MVYISHLYTSDKKGQNVWVLASEKILLIGELPKTKLDNAHILTDNDAPVEFLAALELMERR